ncbi:hypothetical protein Scep_024390 [Stephania cephalantha]|uniref:Uncharacterized protein n=1 Tax=Stephania cephalantha TaxID=152367 RepID=A0AAP0EWG4_9MAGN
MQPNRDRGEGGESGENRYSKKKMEKVEKEMKKEVEVEVASGSASEGNNEGGEGEEGQDSEEVVEARLSAKARGKAKSGPSDKVAANDMSKPFPGGPINHELLTSFNNHVAATPYGIKVRSTGYRCHKGLEGLAPRESDKALR